VILEFKQQVGVWSIPFTPRFLYSIGLLFQKTPIESVLNVFFQRSFAIRRLVVRIRVGICAFLSPSMGGV